MPKHHYATAKFPRGTSLQPNRGGTRPASSPQLRAAPVWEDETPTLRVAGVALAGLSTASPQARATLTVLAGMNAGQMFALDEAEAVIGRGRDVDVLVEEVGVSRRHARILRTGAGYVIEDLRSTNGVVVNGVVVERIELSDGDRIRLGPALVIRFGLVAADEEALARRLYEGSTRDALTGLYNRKYVMERLAAEVAYVRRHGTRVGLIMCDIDHFKTVNDTHGHMAGDLVLRGVATRTLRASRAEDVVARYGGEELLVIVRGVEREGVSLLAERMRASVEALSTPWDSGPIAVTVSMGVATLDECAGDAAPDALLALADHRLYQAKEGGRNRVVWFDDPAHAS